jgi:hypothetical protein
VAEGVTLTMVRTRQESGDLGVVARTASELISRAESALGAHTRSAKAALEIARPDRS